MEERGLKLVGSKTKAAVEKSMEILGLKIDRNLTFIQHAEKAVEKASRMAEKLNRLMWNTGGPRGGKRRAIASAMNNMMLYGSEVWRSAIRTRKVRELVDRLQRKMALKIAAAYRTVSITNLFMVISARFEGKNNREVLNAWEAEWQARESWTKSVIGHLNRWTKRKRGETNYFVTKFLTGHGQNGVYLKKIQKREHDRCKDCGATDDAGHGILYCPRWEAERWPAAIKIGEILEDGNVIGIMLETEDKWRIIEQWIVQIIGTREREARAEVGNRQE
ncbi:uncharacterized protein LOC116163990 [Photinus pyralis]|uniref:uncharacterized protein LOC116163990 n=1 Tax=Photinus pyralis TaxID=7054 RepID=UPI0012670F39|nr:uncharacterized protein LOC116163990 [Photinus pyralis]